MSNKQQQKAKDRPKNKNRKDWTRATMLALQSPEQRARRLRQDQQLQESRERDAAAAAEKKRQREEAARLHRKGS